MPGTQKQAIAPNDAIIKIVGLMRACTPIIIVRGANGKELCQTLSQAAKDRHCYIWDARSGVQSFSEKNINGVLTRVLEPLPNGPKAMPINMPLDWYALAKQLANGNGVEFWKNEADLPRERSMLVMKGVDQFWKSNEFQATLPVIESGLATRSMTILLHEEVCGEIPAWLESRSVVVHWPLPDEATRRLTIAMLKKANGLSESVSDELVRNSAGIPLAGLVQGVMEQIATEGDVTAAFIETYKNRLVVGRGYIEPMERVSADMVGGHDLFIKFSQSRKAAFADPNLPRPGNTILFGPPGTGKSLLAKITGSVYGLPTYLIRVSALLDKYQGEAQRKTNELLKLMDALSPALFFFDEIDKGLGGLKSSNETSGGTLNQVFGELMTHMQESKARNVYMFTCNKISDLPPEFMRRAGTLFWVGFPEASERRTILEIQNRKHGASVPVEAADGMDHFTGAEIERVVIDSFFEDSVEDAIAGVRTVYELDTEKFRAMEAEAVTYCRPTSSVCPLDFSRRPVPKLVVNNSETAAGGLKRVVS